MRLYDYKCEKCNRYFEAFNTVENRHNMECPQCQSKAKKVLSTALRVTSFPEGWWTDVGHKPIYIRSASQLAEECKKRWTPWNKPWPEYLDGISNPGVPNDVKCEGAEGYPTKEELCKKKTERLHQLINREAQS